MKVYNTIIPAKGCYVKLRGIFYQTSVVSRPRLVFIFRSPALDWQSQCHDYTATKQNGVEGVKYQKEVGREKRKEQQMGSKR